MQATVLKDLGKQISEYKTIDWFGDSSLELYRPNSYPDFCKRLSTFSLQNWPLNYVICFELCF